MRPISKISFLVFSLLFTTAAVRDGGIHDWAFNAELGWPDGYESSGKPRVLSNHRNEYSKAFFDRLNESFPERESQVDKLQADALTNVMLDACPEEGCEVSVTLLHEGAGHMNSLGYFVYQADNPPASREEIGQETILFPNFSFKDNRKETRPGLSVGDRVVVRERFRSGQALGFVLVSHGFNVDTGVNDPHAAHMIFYSLRDANPEDDMANRQHALLYYDEESEQLIFGMEDLNRKYNDENDFNDAIFAVTVTPSSAIANRDELRRLSEAEPDDGDGIPEADEDFPGDPERSWLEYLPPSTLAFEDNWPAQGDYDMNDLVIEELLRLHRNASGQVKDLIALHNYVARGAANDNGFALQLRGVRASDISAAVYIDLDAVEASNIDIEETDVQKLLLHPAAQALNFEDDPGGAVMVLHNRTLPVLPSDEPAADDDCGRFRNTVNACSQSEPRRFMLVMTLNQARGILQGNFDAMNPFLTIGQRNHEVHIVGMPPTAQMDRSLFGAQDDDSDPSEGRYYRSSGNLPWGVRVPWQLPNTKKLEHRFQRRQGAWRWPLEHLEIFQAYPDFADWAASDGEDYKDWYTTRRSNPSLTYHLK